jgi:pimeloyl-ACP methyl ester carboxylesterase
MRDFQECNSMENAIVDEQRPGARFVAREIRHDGAVVRIAQAGSGPNLVMLPTSSGLTFNFGADALTEHFRVTMIDPAGWGATPADQTSKPIPELARDTAMLLSDLGIERFHLTGGSMGGIHALWVVAHYPDRVASAVLDGSMAFRKDNWATPGFDPVAFVKAARAGADISAMLPRAHPNKPWATLDYRQQQQQRILRVMEFTGPEFDTVLADALREIEVPILALFGAEDHFVHPSVASVYERTIPGCETRIVEGAGHDIPGEMPALYADLVTRFMRGHP